MPKYAPREKESVVAWTSLVVLKPSRSARAAASAEKEKGITSTCISSNCRRDVLDQRFARAIVQSARTFAGVDAQ